jgi:heptosyltransferase-2
VQAVKEKITVVLPNHLGDVVMATPALRALRQARPEAEISAAIRRELAPVLGGSPWIDRFLDHGVYAVSGPLGPLGRVGRRWRLARALGDADLVILLPNSFSSALLAWTSGARQRLGYDRRGRALLLTHAVPAPRQNGRFAPVAMERYYLDLVAALGCSEKDTSVELFLEPEAERECDALFERHGIDPAAPLVCIAPGAAFGPSKLWPPAYYAEVAAELLSRGVSVALVHAPEEEALADELRARTGPGLASLGGAHMTLSLLKSVLARARLLLCNDAGARHIAAAFRVPALVLMGPTSIHYTNLNLRFTKLLRHPVECSPCQLKVCPIDHRCMTRLSPTDVIEEAQAALADPGWRGDTQLELEA